MKTTEKQTLPRVAVSAATFAALLAQGTASHLLTNPATKTAARLQPGARVVVAQVQPAKGPRIRGLAKLEACVVGRRDEANTDTLPENAVPLGHRGPVASLVLVTDEHADGLRPSGMLYELLPHYVDRHGRRS